MVFEIKYVIVTPARDEEEYIEKTLKSVISQTVKPVEWIIVNDGSTDNTGRIIDECSKEYPWIYPIHRENRGTRNPGIGVMEAFYEGYSKVKEKNWNYIVKLDADLSFEKTYFQDCFQRFESNPKLGIVGGMIYHNLNGRFELENTPLFHVRGATKIYKRECWDAISGLIKLTGWDTFDEVKANMLGWETRSLPELVIIHHRFTGQVEGTWRNCVKNGRANYISGYHPLFMFIKCIKRGFQKPYLIGTIALAYGFLSSYLKKIEQVDDRQLINYLRRQQMRKLTLRDTIWK
jgi:glycosyltransferase involved in cell wall biosynthesis